MPETAFVGAPGLWVVATPIGNLADLSPRVRAALEQAELLLCEDTRRTAKLLSALGIEASGRLQRFDSHVESGSIGPIFERLRAGGSVALVSDAGTPAVSDPGAKLVREAHGRGIQITPIPGPSAVTALVSVAGLGETSFCFRGFFPRKPRERREELALVSASKAARSTCWFESPHRIRETLQGIAGFSSDAELVVGKELTKLHETIFRGSARDVAAAVAEELEREGEVGEWCFLIHFLQEYEAGENGKEDWRKAVICLLECGISASEASRKVSQVFGVAKNDVYDFALSRKEKKSDRQG